jgi:hypothetical protein
MDSAADVARSPSGRRLGRLLQKLRALAEKLDREVLLAALLEEGHARTGSKAGKRIVEYAVPVEIDFLSIREGVRKDV